MDARELTKRYYEMDNKILILQRKCEYLELTVEKLLMRMGDAEVDIKSIQFSMNRKRS